MDMSFSKSLAVHVSRSVSAMCSSIRYIAEDREERCSSTKGLQAKTAVNYKGLDRVDIGGCGFRLLPELFTFKIHSMPLDCSHSRLGFTQSVQYSPSAGGPVLVALPDLTASILAQHVLALQGS